MLQYLQQRTQDTCHYSRADAHYVLKDIQEFIFMQLLQVDINLISTLVDIFSCKATSFVTQALQFLWSNPDLLIVKYSTPSAIL